MLFTYFVSRLMNNNLKNFDLLNKSLIMHNNPELSAKLFINLTMYREILFFNISHTY
jgi:hypothetical protein